MKKSIKTIAATLALITCFGATAMTASAYTERQRTVFESPNIFTNEWETRIDYALKSNGTKIGELIYGYNKNWVDEDYAWSKGLQCRSQAGIQRITIDDYCIFADGYADVNKYSKKEVRHLNKRVNYRVRFESDYNETINEKSYDSNVKN